MEQCLFYTGHWLAESAEGSHPIAVMEVDTQAGSWDHLSIVISLFVVVFHCQVTVLHERAQTKR